MFIPDTAVPAVVTGCVFTSIAFIFVVLRVFSRVFVIKNFGADDYLMVLAMVSVFARCGSHFN
jgi:hypothetical protein